MLLDLTIIFNSEVVIKSIPAEIEMGSPLTDQRNAGTNRDPD